MADAAPPANAVPAPIRVLVVDDHPVVRDGLLGMFDEHPDFEVVGEAGGGEEAVVLVEARRPDVVLMDLRMPRGDGVSAIAELERRGSGARVVVLTTYDTDSDVVPAIEAGATGYLLKDAPREELFRAVRAAAARLFISEATVKTHLLHLYAKLGVGDRAAAVAVAFDRGLLTPGTR